MMPSQAELGLFRRFRVALAGPVRVLRMGMRRVVVPVIMAVAVAVVMIVIVIVIVA